MGYNSGIKTVIYERSVRMTLEEILLREEGQTYEIKSIRIDLKALAIPIVAFANADGGTIAIGITDKTRRVEGVDFEIEKLNEILRVPFDYCIPTVKVFTEMIACTDSHGRDNHILLIHVEPSTEVHSNQADEVYMRVGDKSKKLSFEERIQLMYDKGERYFEDKPVLEAELDDIDMGFVKEYVNKIGYLKSPLEYLMENKGFIKKEKGKYIISTAAILIFGRHPQTYFPRARVRFIRYEGTEEKVGASMNVIKDVSFMGNILNLVNEAVSYLDTQIKEKTYLGEDGKFVTEEEYPKFVRQELIVNAIAHRDYSIKGTDIQIKMFDDRIVVESPGSLPGLVRTSNIRNVHFSRNPKIAAFLKDYKFVKEFGEGVNRIYEEMENAGLAEPTFRKNEFMLEVIVRNSINEKPMFGNEKPMFGNGKPTFGNEKPMFGNEKSMFDHIKSAIGLAGLTRTMEKNIFLVYEDIETNQIFSRADIMRLLKCASSTAGNLIHILKKLELIVEVKGKGKGKYRFKNEDELSQQ